VICIKILSVTRAFLNVRFNHTTQHESFYCWNSTASKYIWCKTACI